MSAILTDAMATARRLHDEAWADAFELIDLQLSPLGLRAMDELHLQAGEVVFDIGCGAGETLVQLAERVAPGGQVVGVDISDRLLGIAAARCAALDQISIVNADAQKLQSLIGPVDAVFSRFGVMAFAEPIAAFTNLRRLLKPSGRMAFCCWRALKDNELDRMPLSAAGFVLADDTPFSLSNPRYVRRLLQKAGFQDIAVTPYDASVTSGDLDAMSSVLLKVGPLGKIIRENPALRQETEPRLRQALASLSDPSEVCLQASVWIVTARASPS